MSRALLDLAPMLVAATSPAAAQEFPEPAVGEAETVEALVRSDFNGDGHKDVAYVTRNDEARELRVMVTLAGEFDIDIHPPQALALDPAPLGNAVLSVKGNVLILQELSNGTSAIDSTHRFRWNPQLSAMQVIGLDARLYSRTYAHDGAEGSWNLLTGDLVTTRMRLVGEAPDNLRYVASAPKRTKRRTPPLRLEAAPSGADMLDWGERDQSQ
jgi:hypothetical protein